MVTTKENISLTIAIKTNVTGVGIFSISSIHDPFKNLAGHGGARL